MRRLSLTIAIACTWLLSGCPDKVDDIGGAPKRRIDHAQESVDRATQNVENRLKRAEDAAEE